MEPLTVRRIEGTPHGDLKKYAQLKLQLGAAVRSLIEVAKRCNDEAASEQARKLIVRLVEDRFNLAVVGEFNRGKSTLMNALLGSDYLPTGVLPLTSVITTVRYGDRERVLLRLKGWSRPREVPLESLRQFVTEEGNPGNQEQVELAEVQLPAELLRLGFYFIDTPGVGSGIAANTVTTKAFLPEADAVIFVSSFDSPFSRVELEFLTQIRSQVREVFIVMNKLDLVTPEDQRKVLEFVKSRIGDAQVFSVSAREGLLAKISGDAERLVASGLPELENTLSCYLRSQKSRVLLARLSDRAALLLRRHEIEFALSQTAGSSPEQAKLLEASLLSRLNHQQEEIQGLVHRLGGKLQLEYPTKVLDMLGPWREGALSALAEQVAAYMTTANYSLLLEGAPGLVETIESACQRTLAQWAIEHRSGLDQAAEALIGDDLKRIEQSLERLFHLTDESSSESPSGGEIHLPQWLRVGVLFPIAPRYSWEFHAPLWTLIVPYSRSQRHIEAHIVEELRELMEPYLERLRGVIQNEAAHWVARLERVVSEREQAVADRVHQMFHGRQQEPEYGEELKRIRAKLEALHAEIQRVGSPATSEGGPARGIATVEAMPAHLNAACTICNRVETALFEFFRNAQYDLAVDEAEKEVHAERGGFCALHTWQYEAVASPQGICEAYPPVLLRTAQRLRKLAQAARAGDTPTVGLDRFMAGATDCSACRVKAAVERSAATDVLRDLETGNALQTPPPPLCLPHLRVLLGSRPSPALVAFLLLEQAAVLDRIAENMEQYALKRDAIRSQLATYQEQRAYYFGLCRLVGNRNLSAAWRVE